MLARRGRLRARPDSVAFRLDVACSPAVVRLAVAGKSPVRRSDEDAPFPRVAGKTAREVRCSCWQ